jgi:hypothetical protein
MVAQGITFLGGGELHGEDHLWIVINDPAAHGGTALIVNISELRSGAETTCVLKAGEHPFITKDSYVRYMSARGPSATDIAQAIKAGKLKPHQTANPALLAKLRAGAQASTMLATELKALL